MIYLRIDFNGPANDEGGNGGAATLVYDPVFQPDGNAGVATGAWRGYDAFDSGEARYWTMAPINGQPAGAVAENLRSLNQIMDANPDATIGNVIVNQGSRTAQMDANVDALRIRAGGKDVTADFEPDPAMLDAYRATKGTGPTVTASADLVAGRSYQVTVSGTSSVFAASLMASPSPKGWAMCGTPEAGPLSPTPGIVNGRAGSDPEFLFAFPQQGTRCNPRTLAALPSRQSNLTFSTDGQTFSRPTTITAGTTPRADHTYTYTVVGADRPLRVRFTDSNYADNYGRYRIDVAPMVADA